MLYDCPECALPCLVEPRGSLTSTHGRVELADVACVAGHRFLMPTEELRASPGDDAVPQRRTDGVATPAYRPAMGPVLKTIKP
jgi:hypothetical protein